MRTASLLAGVLCVSSPAFLGPTFAATAPATPTTTKLAAAKPGAKTTSFVPGSGTNGVKPGLVKTDFSLSVPVVGWARIPTDSWPRSGQAIAVEARSGSIDVRQSPSVGAPGLRFARGISTTGPVTFLAIRDYGAWVQVALPVRPNGTVGWVRGDEVSRIAVPDRLIVELSSNTMVVEKDGAEVLRLKVSTGTGGTPTPTGLFYVAQLITQANPKGPYGPFVFGMSGFSEVLTTFGAGFGGIGIHGTNRPDAIGTSVSHGCIRVTNETVVKLTRFLPLGTPVEIVKSFDELPTQRRANAQPDPDPVFDQVATGFVTIDFPLDQAVLPTRRLDDVDVDTVTPAG